MKKLGKIVSLLLAVAMLMGIAACGGKTTPAASSGTTPATSTPAASTPAASTPSTPEPEPPTKLTVGITAQANCSDYVDNDFTRWLEEKANVEIDFVYFAAKYSDAKTQLNTMITAKEKLPDILFYFDMTDEDEGLYASEGVIAEITPYMNDKTLTADMRAQVARYFGEDAWDICMKSNVAPDGKIYNFPSIQKSESNIPLLMCFINQKWLDKLGLKVPTNYNELVTVLRAFKTQDPNGNGKGDEIPMVSRVSGTSNVPSIIINYFVRACDRYFFNINNGKLWLPWDTNEYREGLKALNSLVKEGLVSDLCWTLKNNSELTALMNPADGVPIVGVLGGGLSTFSQADNPLILDYTGLAPEKYGTMLYGPWNLVQTHGCYITTDCKNPEAAMRLFLAIASSDDGILHMRYGKEGRDWEWAVNPATGVKAPKIIDSTVYSMPNTATWACVASNVTYYGEKGLGTWSDIDANDWTKQRGEIISQFCVDYIENVTAHNAAKEALDFNLLYNEQESEQLGTIATDVMNYVKQARAQFATGELDINSDKDWNEYVKTYQSLGADTWLKVAQSAYDRMMS